MDRPHAKARPCCTGVLLIAGALHELLKAGASRSTADSLPDKGAEDQCLHPDHILIHPPACHASCHPFLPALGFWCLQQVWGLALSLSLSGF